MKERALIYIITLAGMLYLAGCAAIPPEADLHASLRKTAEDYWKLRMAGRYEDAYKMEDSEGLPPFMEYLNIVMAIKKQQITGHSIKDIRVDGNKGRVDVEFSFVLQPVTKPFKQTIPDEWVYKDREWRHVIKKD